MQKSDEILTQSYLKEILSYCPATGIFTWLKQTGRRIKIGKQAGCISSDGYIEIRVNLKLYKAHRLAWLLMTGDFPKNVLDHINGFKSDNRWSNLRAATRSENEQNKGRRINNTSGYKGVSWHIGTEKWLARITTNGKPRYLGIFTTPESAHEAYKIAAKEFHGNFANF